MKEDLPPANIHYQEPVHVTLTRNAKGSYSWEISVHAETTEKALAQVGTIDESLKGKYGGTQE